jgi:hypothetical protein
MATIKRTTTTYRAPQRPAPRPEPEPEYDPPSRRPLQGRLPDSNEPGQLPEYAPDNQWPDVPVDPDSEQLPVSEVVTVGQEQLERSREMQEMGIHNWVAAHDERDPDQQPQQVAGVVPLER